MSDESKGSLTEQVSLFEKVPEEKKLGWSGIASILSGVVSSLTKLMGGGIVAFYAGCYAGLGAAAIMFVLSVVLTSLIGRIAFVKAYQVMLHRVCMCLAQKVLRLTLAFGFSC